MDYSALTKLEHSKKAFTLENEDEIISIIVRVKQPNYQPNSISVRSQISPFIFTADIKAKDLTVINEDSLVKSVSLSRYLSNS